MMKARLLQILLPVAVISIGPGCAVSDAPVGAGQRQPGAQGVESMNLVFNGDFELAEARGSKPRGWTFLAENGSAGDIERVNENPADEANPHSLRLNVTTHKGRVGVANSGRRGMNIREDQWYDLTFSARTVPTNKTFGLVVSLESPDGKVVCARATIPEVSGVWREYRLPLHTRLSHPAARMIIAMPEAGTIWLDRVSLIPRRDDPAAP
ncbi:MAG TPA: hypothetical protein PKH32_07260 [Verrucomicrobiota bacterium]|nr:hypothetical protein [Verrucomicrobiota bacterium]